MKPRTEFERQVVMLNERLKPIGEKPTEWAVKNIIVSLLSAPQHSSPPAETAVISSDARIKHRKGKGCMPSAPIVADALK